MPPSPSFGLDIRGAMTSTYEALWTTKAKKFIVDLAAGFAPRRDQLLARRIERQKQFDAGASPDFVPETAAIRSGDWKVAPIPVDLEDRRVEITGPVERKMIINA